mgnify:CR=1 FL=1
MTASEYYIDWERKGKKRPKQHITSEKSICILKELLPDEWVVREYSPDYGIDLDIELFEDLGDQVYKTLGEHVLFQVKGTEKISKQALKLYSRKNVEKEFKEDKSNYCIMEVIQYPIDTDLLTTIERMGSAVPVLLCVVDIENRDAYCVCLNDYIEKILIPNKSDFYNQKTVTINIPIKNCISTDFGKHLIEWYGKRAKLYAFFNKVHYQLEELNYCSNLEYVKLTDHFLKILCRLDVWDAADYFSALKLVKEELDYYLEYHNTKTGNKMLKAMFERGEDIESKIYEATYCIGEVSFREANLIQSLHLLWEQLSNVAHIFEENMKEAFLPSYFSNIISY